MIGPRRLKIGNASQRIHEFGISLKKRVDFGARSGKGWGGSKEKVIF
jgi:hypothetical protein